MKLTQGHAPGSKKIDPTLCFNVARLQVIIFSSIFVQISVDSTPAEHYFSFCCISMYGYFLYKIKMIPPLLTIFPQFHPLQKKEKIFLLLEQNLALFWAFCSFQSKGLKIGYFRVYRILLIQDLLDFLSTGARGTGRTRICRTAYVLLFTQEY